MAVVLLAVVSLDISDDNEARADIPALDVRDLNGNSLVNKGAILDNAELDVRADTVFGEGTTYTVTAGDVLVDGSLYLIVRNAPNDTFSLSGYIFNFNEQAKLFGLRFSLYDSPSCTGSPAATTVFDIYSPEERIFAEDLRTDCRYYIKVETVRTISSATPLSIGGIGFGFTASLDSEYHAVYYVSDGETVSSTLLRNGSHYVFPEISKEGCTLIGWYDSPEYGTLYRESDVVDLDGDLYLYAFWWDGGSESLTYRTLDCTEVTIDVKVEDRVTVSVRAVTEDGKISVDIADWDVSQRIAVIPVNVALADGETFTENDAARCADITDLISVWFEGRSLGTVPYAVFDGHDVSISSEALGVLSENGFGLHIGKILPSIDFDNTAVKGLKRSVPDNAAPYRFIVREATETDLTPEQVEAVKGDPYWLVLVTVGGVEVHDIGGTVEITLPYTPEHDDPHISARWVSPDGNLTDVPSVFDNNTMAVTITTDHLSIYSVHAEYDDSQDELLPYLALLAISIILGVLMVYRIWKP